MDLEVRWKGLECIDHHVDVLHVPCYVAFIVGIESKLRTILLPLNMFVTLSVTLMPGDYDSFAVMILSQTHRGIDISESIAVSIKVVIRGHEKTNFQLCSLWVIPGLGFMS